MSQAVVEALLDIDAVGFSPKSPITFKSGIVSPVYVDNRRLPYHPEQWHIIIKGFIDAIHQHEIAYDLIAGVAVGGVPHSSALAYALKQPSVFVRKEAKAHGKTQRIEGGDVEGKRVVLVEDLVTTGGSSLSGIEALRDSGATVDTLLAIVSYGFAEAVDNLAINKIDLVTLTNFQEILDEAMTRGLFSMVEADVINDWFDDPHSWAERQGLA